MPPSPGIPIKPVCTGLSIISQRTRVCAISDNLVYSFWLALLRRCGSHRGSVFTSTLAIQPLANGWSPEAVANEKSRYYCTGSFPPRFPGGQCMSNGFQTVVNDYNRNHYTRIPALRKNFTKKMLAGSSFFPLSRAYPAPHLNQAPPLVTNTAED